MSGDDPTPPEEKMLNAVRLREERRRRAESEPSLARYLGQVGILGWAIVLPTLVALYVGRKVDHYFGTGVFWTAPALLIGLGFGCWMAWKWMQRQ